MTGVIQERNAKTRQLVKYVPKIRERKWYTDVTDRHGGLHKQEEFKKGVAMLEFAAHSFRNPRLFHICLTGANLAIYQLAMTRFCRALAGAGVDYCYKAALEHDSTKGLHFHIMIVLGTEKQTHRYITSSDETEKIENESALRKAIRHTWNECCNLRYRVNPPQSRQGLAFIQFNQSNVDYFNEAVEWMSYLYKARSKPERGTVYFSNRHEA